MKKLGLHSDEKFRRVFDKRVITSAEREGFTFATHRAPPPPRARPDPPRQTSLKTPPLLCFSFSFVRRPLMFRWKQTPFKHIFLSNFFKIYSLVFVKVFLDPFEDFLLYHYVTVLRVTTLLWHRERKIY